MPDYFFNPLNYILCGFILAFFLDKTLKKRLLIGLFVALLLVSLPIIPYKLIQLREFSLPPQPVLKDKDAIYHIIVLGAGKNDDRQLKANQRLSRNAMARLVEGVKWMHQLPNAKLITSGPQFQGDLSQAELMKQTAVLLGVEATRIETQPEVFNTANEAKVYFTNHGTETPLIVCTSAIHLPRAVKWFAHYGVANIHPAPAYYHAPQKKLEFSDFMPSWQSFELWQNWIKESLGTTNLVFRMQE